MTMYILGGVVVFVLVLVFILAMLFRVVVPANEVHIVQTAKKTVSYGKDKDSGNVYFNFPESLPKFGNVCTVLPVSVFSVNLQNYDAYDADRLPFVVDITAFFRIQESDTAAQRVANFEELRTQLNSILQGAARTILAESTIEKIMEGRGEYGDKFTKEVNGQLKDWGVCTVKNIELMDIRDAKGSNVINNIMAKKKSEIEKESRIEVANNQRAAKVSEIENIRQAEVAQQEAQQQIGIRTAEKDREVGISNETAQQAIQESAKITAEKEMEVKRVRDTREAEIEKSVTITRAEEQRKQQEIGAEAQLRVEELDSEAIKVKAQAEAKEIELKAEAEAKEISLKGEAQAEAAKQLEMANVDPQIELAKEIGSNNGYQNYLIEIRKVEMNETVGIKQAEALTSADLKVIANSGDVDGGVNSLMNILTPNGGTKVAGSLEALAQSDVGQAFLTKMGFDMINKPEDNQ